MTNGVRVTEYVIVSMVTYHATVISGANTTHLARELPSARLRGGHREGEHPRKQVHLPPQSVFSAEVARAERHENKLQSLPNLFPYALLLPNQTILRSHKLVRSCPFCCFTRDQINVHLHGPVHRKGRARGIVLERSEGAFFTRGADARYAQHLRVSSTACKNATNFREISDTTALLDPPSRRKYEKCKMQRWNAIRSAWRGQGSKPPGELFDTDTGSNRNFATVRA